MRRENLVILLVAILSTVPLIWPPIPPLGDVPGHLGRYAIAQHSDPFFAHFYSYRWRPIGNLGVDGPVFLLAKLIGVEAAAKAVILCIPPLTTTGILLSYRAIHGRLTPFGLLACCFVYAFPLHAGFLNYCLGIGVGWICVWLWLEGRFRAMAFVFLGGLLWFIHALAWGLTAAVICGIQLGGATDARSLARRGLALVPFVIIPVAMQAYWLAFAAGRSDGWFAWSDKASALLRVLQYQDRLLGPGLLVAVAAFGAAFALGGIRIDRRMATATGFVALVFIVLPHGLMSSWATDNRVAVLLFMCGLVALAPRQDKPIGAALALFAAVMGLWTVTYLRLSRELTDFLEIAPSVPRHSRVAYFYVEPCDPYAQKIGPNLLAAGILIGRRHVFTGQWDYPGMNLLSVHYPPAGEFQGVTLQTPRSDLCGHVDHSFEASIRHLPVAAFDYLIVSGPGPRKPPPFPMIYDRRDTQMFDLTRRSK